MHAAEKDARKAIHVVTTPCGWGEKQVGRKVGACSRPTTCFPLPPSYSYRTALCQSRAWRPHPKFLVGTVSSLVGSHAIIKNSLCSCSRSQFVSFFNRSGADSLAAMYFICLNLSMESKTTKKPCTKLPEVQELPSPAHAKNQIK